MEGNIAFKAFLHKDNGDSPAEVRWFYVEQNAIVSLQNVKEKLQATFPCLTGNNYTLSWKDCDGDMVAISSDAELLIALTNIRSEPRRLYIHVKEDVPKQSNPNVPDSPQSVLHHGVICDACNGEIYGFRYKCIECPDFDLCIGCEMKNEHAEHCFIRITDPAASSRLRKCLSHQLGKKIFKGYSTAERDTKPDGRKHHKRHHGHARHGWFEMLSKYMNDANMAMAEENTTNAANEANRGAGEPSNLPRFPRCPYGPRAPPQGEEPFSANDVHVSYLKNIGQTIANLLDPLGIDVDVDVRTRTTTTPAATSMETEETVPEATTTTAPPKPAEPASSTENKTTQSEPVVTSTTTENCNRAVPVFPPNFIPVYTTCSAGMATPIVSAFVNGAPMETENGWTLLDETETQTSTNASSSSSANASGSTSMNGNVSDNSQKKSDTESQAKPTEANAKENVNGTSAGNTNENTNGTTNGNANQGPQHPMFDGFMRFGGPMPQPPQPGFNFDHMARELQKHIQTHFKGAMSTAATVASNVAHNVAHTAAASAMNQPPFPFPPTAGTQQNVPTTTPTNNQGPTNATGAVPRAPTQKVYPNLPTQVNVTVQSAGPKPATAPPQPRHQSEAVTRGLETMLAMGFNNEGGWLTTVLECTHGDVTKALDLLQPVKK